MEISKEAEVIGDGLSSSSEAASSNSRNGMKREVYKAAEKGSVDELQWHNNWKHERTAGGNNVLHIHLGKTKEIRSGVIDVDVSMSFIRYVIDETFENSALLQSNDKGDTPLHFAARFGYTGAVREFLKRSDVVSDGLLNKANNCMDTALHDATRGGYLSIVRLLAEAGGENALHHMPNNLGETPLFLAAERGCLNRFNAIVEHTGHTALEHKGPCGHTALHVAVMCKNTKIVNRILEIDTTSLLIRVKNDDGYTPLHCCAVRNVKKENTILRALLDHDDEYNSAAYMQDNEGRTPLHIAILNFNFNAAEMLILFYPDCVEMVDNKGHNMLHIAAKIGIQTFQRVLKKMPMCDRLINEKDSEGNTPLHLLVAAEPTPPLFKVNNLLKKQKYSDVRAFNNKNLTAGDILADKDDVKVTKFWQRTINLRKSRRILLGGNEGQGAEGEKTIDNVLKNKGRREKKERMLNNLQKLGDTHLLVAALIATMSFTAGFTLPGGFDQSPGKTIGLAVLAKKKSFVLFLVSDTIAFTLSSMAVSCYFSAAANRNNLWRVKYLLGLAYLLNTISLGALMMAFVAGVYTTISQFPGLAFTLVAISLLYFLFYFFMLLVQPYKSISRFSKYGNKYTP